MDLRHPSQRPRPPSRAPQKPRAKKPKRPLWQRLLLWGAVASFALALVGGGVVAVIFWRYAQDLPPIFSRADFIPRQVTRIYDRDGNLLAELFDERRTLLAAADIPPLMVKAITAAEDAHFFEHHGLDTIGILRAAYTNVRRGSFSQGASTLTQQVVKNLLLTSERTLKRKVQEVLLSRRLEDNFTKEDILWMYLNYVYFGHGNYGLTEAARYFFDVHPKDLDLNACATLAGLVQSPERLSPIKHLARARERRDYVLRQMHKLGHIDDATFQATVALDIPLRRPQNPSLGAAPHFVEHVRQHLITQYGRDYVYTAGLRVYTTLSLPQQAAAEDALRAGLLAYDDRQGYQRKTLSSKYKPKKGEHIATLTEVAATHLTASAPSLHPDPLPLLLSPRVLPASPTAPADRADLTSGFKANDRVRVALASPDDIDRAWRALPAPAPPKPTKALVFAPSAEGALVEHRPPHPRGHRPRRRLQTSRSSSFNRATQAMRQTGSSFKPLDLRRRPPPPSHHPRHRYPARRAQGLSYPWPPRALVPQELRQQVSSPP
jgi:penicillin-binding protein 1A